MQRLPHPMLYTLRVNVIKYIKFILWYLCFYLVYQHLTETNMEFQPSTLDESWRQCSLWLCFYAATSWTSYRIDHAGVVSDSHSLRIRIAVYILFHFTPHEKGQNQNWIDPTNKHQASVCEVNTWYLIPLVP